MNEYPDNNKENAEENVPPISANDDAAAPETGTSDPQPVNADTSPADSGTDGNSAGAQPPFDAQPQENYNPTGPIYTPESAPSQNPYAQGQPNTENQYSPMPQYPPQYTPYKVNGSDGKPPKKKGRYWVIGILVCIIIVCMCVGVTVLLNNQKKGSLVAGGSDTDTTTQDTTNSISLNVQPTPSQEEMLSTADAVKKATPSVCGVVAYSSATSSAASSGSGIILTSDGYIVTNHHVVDGYTNSLIKVVLSDGDTYEAKYIASDSYSDIAVLKIDAQNLTPAEIGDSDDLAPGEFVVAIGNPGGLTLQGTSTFGMVSAVDRSITVNGVTMKCIQTDAAINPGNSGGALINLYGQVIGINSAKLVETGYEGIGFSIPINTAKPIIDQLISTGKSPSRAFLGITYSEVDEMQAKYYNIPQGVRIESIYDQSSLKNTQAAVGDIIIQADGTDITGKQVFLDLINSKKVGDTVSLKLYRPNYGNGQTYEINVTLISDSDVTEQQTTTQSRSDYNSYGNNGGSSSDNGNSQYGDFQDYLNQFGW